MKPSHLGLALLAAVLVTAGPREKVAHGAPAKDNREMQARESYAAGRYQDSLDLFVKLYAEKLHPNYLRNIGRCYQNLGDPDKAISSFREYLRKAKGVKADERAEIDGYIKEMEELKRRKDSSAAAPPVDKPVEAGPVPPPAPLPPAPAPSEASPVIAMPVSTPADAPASDGSPVYRRWWFWTIVAGVVVAGAVGVLVLSRRADPPCEAGRICK